MLPGVDMSITTAVVGRLSLARRGVDNALAGLFPTLVDAAGHDVVVDSLQAAATAAQAVLEWAEPIILEQEQRADATR
jgi:hypothetical protein